MKKLIVFQEEVSNETIMEIVEVLENIATEEVDYFLICARGEDVPNGILVIDALLEDEEIAPLLVADGISIEEDTLS